MEGVTRAALGVAPPHTRHRLSGGEGRRESFLPQISSHLLSERGGRFDASKGVLFHVKQRPQLSVEKALAERAHAVRLSQVNCEFGRRLEIYVDMLGRWRKATNLVSEASFAQVWSRHIADSAQLLKFAPKARRWIDIGSGAGFPGLVIALQLASSSGSFVHLVESDRRKCAFLREVARATSAPALVHAVRVESLDAEALGTVDAVTARAFAPLPSLIGSTVAWLSHGATGVFPCGRATAGHMEAIATASGFRMEKFPSLLDPDARVVRIRGKFVTAQVPPFG
jgi:16S rRNA (guanine527-N7)-methyltransferase